MASRRRSRERALQMIFQWEASGDAPSLVIDRYWGSLSDSIGERPAPEDDFANALLYGVTRHKETLDERIRRHSANWRLERMSPVDRNILRLAAFELDQGQPPAIIINEAIELGRRYSGPDSVGFLNGVLDAIRKSSAPEPSSSTAETATESNPSAGPRSDQS